MATDRNRIRHPLPVLLDQGVTRECADGVPSAAGAAEQASLPFAEPFPLSSGSSSRLLIQSVARGCAVRPGSSEAAAMDIIKVEIGNGWLYVKLGRRDWFWKWGSGVAQ